MCPKCGFSYPQRARHPGREDLFAARGKSVSTPSDEPIRVRGASARPTVRRRWPERFQLLRER